MNDYHDWEKEDMICHCQKIDVCWFSIGMIENKSIDGEAAMPFFQSQIPWHPGRWVCATTAMAMGKRRVELWPMISHGMVNGMDGSSSSNHSRPTQFWLHCRKNMEASAYMDMLQSTSTSKSLHVGTNGNHRGTSSSGFWHKTRYVSCWTHA